MTDYTKLSEKDLVELLQQDKLGAFQEILNSYLFTSVSHIAIDSYRKEILKIKYSNALKIIHIDNSTEENILLKDLSLKIESSQQFVWIDSGDGPGNHVIQNRKRTFCGVCF